METSNEDIREKQTRLGGYPWIRQDLTTTTLWTNLASVRMETCTNPQVRIPELVLDR